MLLVFEEPQDNDWEHATTLSGLSLHIPLLYIASKTGERLPDLKNQIHDHCRACGIPTPSIFTADDHPLPAVSYIVKPVDGCRAKGLVFTSDPTPYLNDRRVVVQEVVRNCPELRRLWGSDALGTVRLMTVAIGDRYELVCSLLRIPVGDSRIDNSCHGNGFALVDRGGRLSRFYPLSKLRTSVPCHPTTGVTVEGVVIPRFEDCAELALIAHQRLAPYAPYFNSDIAPTDQGPMLIEVNIMPGLPTLIFDDRLTAKFVHATCLALERALSWGTQGNGRAIGQWSSPASDDAPRYPRRLRYLV
ncbi:MAG: sugar-transfer associated ATP-grasp domain-containing protein [Pirellulales bacterium]